MLRMASRNCGLSMQRDIRLCESEGRKGEERVTVEMEVEVRGVVHGWERGEGEVGR